LKETKNFLWFKEAVAPRLEDYKPEYRFYEQGEFGSFDQAIFNSPKKGGEIDFGGLGWLSIHLWDYEKNEQLLNVHFVKARRCESK
jgi:hypothetical protein